MTALMETVHISTRLMVQTLIAVGVRTATHDFPGAHRWVWTVSQSWQILTAWLLCVSANIQGQVEEHDCALYHLIMEWNILLYKFCAHRREREAEEAAGTAQVS